MPEIEVMEKGGDAYRVVVHEAGGSTTHEVIVTEAALQQYGGGAGPEDLLEASFEFLLEREPKESILSKFDLPVIEKNFPEFPDEIWWRLD